MSFIEALKEKYPDLYLSDLIQQYPEVEAVGREGFAILPANGYHTYQQVDVVKLVNTLYTALPESPKVHQVRETFIENAPWLVKHLPEWVFDEHAYGVVTPAAIADLSLHMAEVAFKHRTLRADFMLDKERSTKDTYTRLKFGIRTEVRTSSGVSHVILRPHGPGSKRIQTESGIAGYGMFVSRAEVSGDARKGFPRKAIWVTIFPVEGSVDDFSIKTECSDVTFGTNDLVRTQSK